MLANNNQAIIRRLAKNTVRTNKKQFGILFLTVALSAFLLFCVFTIGITWLDLGRQQNTRLNGAEYDIVTMNGFTPQQQDSLRRNPRVESVGTESYAGFIRNTEFDDTAETGLLWCDEIFWEQQMAPARTETEGSYPQKKNEIMVTREILETWGNAELTVGDHLLLTYETNKGVSTDEFTISGIWNGYGDRSAAFVSEEFYRQSGYLLENDGILYVKLKQNFVLPGTLDTIEESLSLSGRQIFAPLGYIENSFTYLLGICGLCLVICLSAYLLIYNILYLSVSGKIRYYGLLQTLGMTKKQLVSFIRKQMLLTGAAGLAAGIVLGYVVSLALVPYMMGVLGITMGNTEFHFYPGVLAVSILVAGAAFLGGIRKPVRMASEVSPIEAAKFRGTVSKRKSYQNRKGNFFWRMALEQLRKDKKKSVVVFLSLAASLSVFYCLTTIAGSQGERTVLPNYWDADLVIRNQTQTSEDMNSLQRAIDDVFLSDVERTEGVREVHAVEGAPVVFPYISDGFSDMWIRNYIEKTPYLSLEDTIADYKENPGKYYGMLKGIDEEEFDYLNQSLAAPVDKEDFLNGEVCIVQYDGSEVTEEYLDHGEIPFFYGDREYKISVGGVSYESYYSGRNIGATLIVSQNYLKSLAPEPYVLSLIIKYEESYDETVETEILEKLEESPFSNDLFVDSKYENRKTIQDSQGDMMEVSTVIALLLLLVGVLNYVNTMTCGIENRRLTFSVMESLGMSGRQIRQLLIREGFLYAIFSILITMTAGTAVTYLFFQMMNYMGAPFSIPEAPLIAAFALVILICLAAPLAAYRRMTGKRSVVDRLREYEQG